MAKDEDELQVIEDDPNAASGEVVGDGEQQEQQEQQQSQDARVSQEEGDDEAQGATEAIREQRRAERRAKKQREHAARDRNRKELDYLRARNEQLERRFSAVEQRTFQSEFTQVDTQLATIENQMRQADQIIQKGIEDRDGRSVTEAQNIKEDLTEAKRRLIAQKEAIAREARASAQPQQQEQQQQQQFQAPQVDPELVEHANRWKAQNPWYRPDRADQDSRIVGVIDEGLAAEGYDPTSVEYWDELSARVKSMLPQHYQQNGNGHARARGEARGPQMANGARERALKPGEVYVSPERKAALVEMGVWDDPKLRQRYLKSFANWDADASQSNA